MVKQIRKKLFLGREFYCKTMTYAHTDGSGGIIPEEMRYDMEIASCTRVLMEDGRLSGNGVFVLGEMFLWKERLGIKY